MKNDVFFDLLQSLDKDQLKRFEKYLRIYINEDHQAIRLVEEYSLLRKIALKKEEALDREKLFDAFITKCDVTRKHFSNLIGLIHEPLKEFLVLERLKRDNTMYDYLLASIYLENGLIDQWESYFKKAVDRQKEQLNDPEAHLALSRLYYLRYFFLGLEQHEREEQNALESMLHLDEYYISLKLKLATELLSREKIIGTKSDFRFLTELLQALEQQEKDQFSAYQLMYKHALMLLLESEEANYSALKEILYQDWQALPLLEVANILNLLSNYNAKQIRNGIDQYEEAYEICKKTIEFACIHHVNANFLLNGILLSADREDAKSTTQFFDILKQKYPTLEEAISISQAMVAISEKDYHEVLRLLPDNQQFPLSSLGIRARVLKVQAHYELDEIELLDGSLHAFENFCNREKKNPSLNQETLDGVSQFIQLLRKLMNLAPMNKADHKNLYDNILNSIKIAAKPWLLRKIRAKYNFE